MQIIINDTTPLQIFFIGFVLGAGGTLGYLTVKLVISKIDEYYKDMRGK